MGPRGILKSIPLKDSRHPQNSSQTPAKRRRAYTDEFKREAVKMIFDGQSPRVHPRTARTAYNRIVVSLEKATT